ncbi:hypothetical protein diail_318 [Diaporthe ilicicola]|nr:hypothetical protein diail_318 [Diaporthe ilicicola]
MIGRSALTRGARLALRRQDCASLAQRRGYAAAAASTETASYESADINGIKVASRDPRGPTARIAVVAKAGTRYQPLPGLSNTDRRSALRITREAELLGGQLTAYHTREALVVEAAFLRNDLPYFTELLGEVITKTRYSTHEFHEEIETIVHLKQAKLTNNALSQALDNAHSVAFHKGLGSSIYPSSSTTLGPYLNENSIAAFAEAVYTKPNIAIVADGTTQANLSKWVEPFFRDVPASASGLQLFTEASKYYGGEQRTSLAGSNAMVLAFPGHNLHSDKADVAVLTALLGGESSIKWSPGFSLLSKASAASGSSIRAKNLAYTDTGLMTIQITGSSAAVRKGAEEAVKALKSVSESGVTKEVLTKAIAKAKFDLLSQNELTGTGIVSAGNSLIHGGKIFQVAEALKGYEGVTAEKVKAAAKAVLDGKATVAASGDLFVLPYAEEIGLKV